MKIGSLVHIFWADSTLENRWSNVDGMVSGVDDCESIGWLVRDATDFITISGHRSNKTDSWAGIMTIPRIAIKKIKRIS